MKRAVRFLRITLLLMAVLAVTGIAVMAWLWQDRASLDELPWPVAALPEKTGGEVTVTWLGVTTLLFDDGETQILTDGHFTLRISHAALTGLYVRIRLWPTAIRASSAISRSRSSIRNMRR